MSYNSVRDDPLFARRISTKFQTLTLTIAARVSNSIELVVALARRSRTWLVARFDFVLARLGPRSERAITVGFVALLHTLLIVALLAALVPHVTPVRELSLSLIGGPLGSPRETPKPVDLAEPDVQLVPPPVIDIEAPAIGDTMQTAAGSPNVSRPAMALPSAHGFPFLPAPYMGAKNAAVRLLLSVARDGTISAADVEKTSGIAALDQLAIEWVKAHWRYQPALTNGDTVAVQTIASVTFVPAT